MLESNVLILVVTAGYMYMERPNGLSLRINTMESKAEEEIWWVRIATKDDAFHLFNTFSAIKSSQISFTWVQ